MQLSPTAIDDYLGSLSGESVYYCPNPGNPGDALIALATYRLLRKHGIAYQVFPFQKHLEYDLSGQVVVFGGGGSFDQFFNAAARFIEQIHRQARRLIVLPQTVAAHAALLQELGSNVEVLCREPVSYEYARQTVTRAQVLLVEDLAFTIDVREILAQKPVPSWNFMPRRRWIKKWIMLTLQQWRKALLDVPSGSRRVLNCFRGGGDVPDYPIPANNIDVSWLMARDVQPEPLAHQTVHRFLRYLSRFELINTNRLHAAVAAAGLGRRVNLHPNSHHKNRAVYDFSIKDRFPHVTWMG
jgi:exopolysaccharide biosynthesis predicted pyruvyltransferase EpsI